MDKIDPTKLARNKSLNQGGPIAAGQQAKAGKIPAGQQPKVAPQIVIPTATLVRVRLMGDTETRKRWIQVSVRSNMKESLWNHREVDIEEVHGDRVERDVQEAAELLANFQCMQYRDRHNPTCVGKAAREALEDMKKQAKDAREGRGSGR